MKKRIPFNIKYRPEIESGKYTVETRDGRPARIVCWDLKCDTPIIAAIQWNQEREDCYCYNTIGRCANNVCEIDLFIVTNEEEEELNEFESALMQFAHVSFDSPLNIIKGDAFEKFKKRKDKLLQIARKELYEEFVQQVEKYVYDKGYEQGKADALKDLPKWKKYDKNNDNIPYITINEKDKNILIYKGYYIPISEIETLLKEE